MNWGRLPPLSPRPDNVRFLTAFLIRASLVQSLITQEIMYRVIVFTGTPPPLKVSSTEKLIYTRLGVSSRA